MTTENAQDWSNYWQGRAGAEAGAALAGAGVEDLPRLNAFWQSAFDGLSAETRVLDLACGAGSALKHAAEAGLTHLTGADISDGAIAALKQRLPTATGVTCSASDTPFADQSFDMVVSQFGLEYAGIAVAGREASRLVAPGGQFIAVCHYQGGAIEQEVSERLAAAVAILESRFVDCARAITREAFGATGFTEESKAAFETARAMLETVIRQDASGLATHLYQGFRQLFERRQAYLAEDITGWLSGMEHEIKAFVGRMQSMKDAALSEAKVADLLAALSASGFDVEAPEAFALKEGGAPGAWVIKARRL